MPGATGLTWGKHAEIVMLCAWKRGGMCDATKQGREKSVAWDALRIVIATDSENRKSESEMGRLRKRGGESGKRLKNAKRNR